MNGFLVAIQITFLLTVAITATGWTIGELANIRCLRGRRVEAKLGQAFLGTAIWILAFGLCSHLGASVRSCRIPLAAAMFAAFGCALWLRSPHWHRLRSPSGPTRVCIFAAALALSLTYWPLVHCSAAWPFNDTLVYCMISQRLQDRGFGEATTIDPDLPATRFINEFQVKHWRMGSTFLLALVQGFTSLDPLMAFPVVMGWGMLLNLAGIFLLARWGLHLNRWTSSGAVLCAATALNPLYTSIHQGFQPQMYGTAFLLVAIALLCRASRRMFWSRGHAFFLASVGSAFVSSYSEMAPILAFAAIVYCARMICRRDDRDSWLRFAAWTVFMLIVLGHVEWLRAVRALNAALGVTVGYPISWNDVEYIGFAVGQLHFQHRDSQVSGRLIFIAVACLLVVLGMSRNMRDRRTFLPAVALLVFVGMALWFRFGAIDPRTGDIGHRWSLFKVVKWSFPLLLVIQFAGLALLLRRWRLHPAACLLPGILALAMSYTYHREYNQWAGHATRNLSTSGMPLAEWKALGEELHRRGVTTIYLEHPGKLRQPHILLPMVLHSHRFVNGWKGCELEELRECGPTNLPPGTAILRIGHGEGEPLPGNVSLMATVPHAPAPSVAAAVRGIASEQNSTNR